MNKLTRLAGRLAALAFALGLTAVQAQNFPIPQTFFGINYTYYAPPSDAFADFMLDLSSVKLGMVRIGGNSANNYAKGQQYFVDAINNVKKVGAVPVVQLPIDIPSSEVANWVATFSNLGVTYFAVGNEPDPGDDQFGAWYANTTSTDVKLSYQAWKSKFVAIATAVKNAMPGATIVGPDFRLFYGSTTDAASPFGGFYKDFFNTVATQVITPTNSTARQLLDVFTYHYYASGPKTEADLADKYANLQTLLNTANGNRPHGSLKTALGEVNQIPNAAPYPWDFEAGQFIVRMAKHTLLTGGIYFSPWSIREDKAHERIASTPTSTSYNFGVYDYVSGDDSKVQRRSSMWHLALLSENRQQNYIGSQMQAPNADITLFGMKGAGGYTVMIMNGSESDLNYGASMTAGTYAGSSGLQLSFDGASGTTWTGTLKKKSTLLYTFDAAGVRLYKYEIKKYNSDGSVDASPEPLVTKLSERFSTAGVFQLTSVPVPDNYLRPLGGNVRDVKIIQQYSSTKPGSALTSYQWKLVPATLAGYTQDWYYLKNVATGQLVRPILASTTAGEVTEQIDDNATNQARLSTLWRPEMREDGSFWLKNANSGLYLRPDNGSGVDGTQMVHDLLNNYYSSYRWNIKP